MIWFQCGKEKKNGAGVDDISNEKSRSTLGKRGVRDSDFDASRVCKVVMVPDARARIAGAECSCNAAAIFVRAGINFSVKIPGDDTLAKIV